MFGSFGHKTGESRSEHCIDGEQYYGTKCLAQFVLCQVHEGSTPSHMLLAPGASAANGQNLGNPEGCGM